MDEQMHSLEHHKARSEATARPRSNVCAECRWISYGGRCNNTDRKARYSTLVFGREACEGFEKCPT